MTAPTRTRTVTPLPPEPAELAPASSTPRVTIEDLIASTEGRRRIEPFIRPGVTIERIQRKVMIACQENPELLKCERWSVIDSIGKIEDWGLEIGETAYLVPFNVKVSKKGEPDRYQMRCKPIVGYMGIVQRIREIKTVRDVVANAVYDCDAFEIRLGDSQSLDHRPSAIRPKGAKLIGAYVIVFLAYGYRHIKYLTADEADAIRQGHSKGWKNGPLPPWYCVKSACRQAGKMFKGRRDFDAVTALIDEDERNEFEEESESTAPVQQAVEVGPGGVAKPDGEYAQEETGEEPNYENAPFPDGEFPLSDSRPARGRNAVEEGR